MNKKKITMRILALVAAMSLVAAACGSDDVAVGTGDCDSVDSVSLQLQWLTQAQFAGYYAAVDSGIYADYCLDVTILEGGVDIVPHCSNLLRAPLTSLFHGYQKPWFLAKATWTS